MIIDGDQAVAIQILLLKKFLDSRLDINFEPTAFHEPSICQRPGQLSHAHY